MDIIMEDVVIVIIMKIMSKIKRCILAFVVACVMVACGSKVVYDNTVRVAEPAWHRDSVARFEVAITDTAMSYESAILIRNSGDYAYQNLWLFVTEISPDSTCSRDTIQYFLADEYGRWLGSGIGSLYTSLFYYKEDLHYSQEGTYIYIIEQGMREDELKGITNIGIQIGRKE